MKKGLKKVLTALITGVVMTGACSINASASEILLSNDFENNSYLPWHTYVGEYADANCGVKNGKYQIEILKPGGANNGGIDRWDIQLRHRGVSVKWGHRYILKYEITSTNDGSYYTAISVEGGGAEAWHNNSTDLSDYVNCWGRVNIKAGETKTVELMFMPTETIENGEWAFSVGGAGQYTATDCFPEGTVLTFDNMSIEDITMDDTLPEFNEKTAGNFVYSQNETGLSISAVTNQFKESDMVLPAYIKNIPVSEISKSAYHDFFFDMKAPKNLKSVTIPSTIETIKDKTFGYYNGEPIEGFVVRGVKGTEAEAYAERNGLTFEEVILENNSNSDYKNFLLNASEFYNVEDSNSDANIDVFDYLKVKQESLK